MADPQIDAVLARLRAELAAAAKGFVLEARANLAEATPVKTGHAQANWVGGAGEPFEGEDDGAAQVAGDAAILVWQLGEGPLSISNNVPYIDRLIAGSSSQAPAGWDVTAIDEAAATVQAQYDGLTIDVSSGGVEASVKISPRGAP
jgi:hypothetical protein